VYNVLEYGVVLAKVSDSPVERLARGVRYSVVLAKVSNLPVKRLACRVRYKESKIIALYIPLHASYIL
jgi:hypothetical protein